MTTPARGALHRVILNAESAFRTPAAAAAFVMPFTSWDVKRAPNRQANNAFNQSPLAEKTDAGDPTVSGSFSAIFELRTIGRLLKLALGAPTTGKAVTKQPTNVTGVTIHYGSSDNANGNGTIAFVASGSTLSWKTNAGTTGATVDVSAGGNFTLESGGGGKSIRVTVVAASLPGTDQTDTDIAVSSTLKAHAFPVNTSARPSALFESQHSDLSKYYRVTGAKVGRLGWNVLDNEQNVTGEIVAGAETEESSAFDANPTSVTWVRACAGKGQISDGSTGLGTVVGGSLEINNNLQPYMAADGLEGAGCIDEGELMIGGSMKTVWDSQGAYAKARAGTSTRLRLESAGISGSDTFRLVIDGLYAELTENAPAKQGKSGLFADVGWKFHRGLYVPEIYLVNDVASY